VETDLLIPQHYTWDGDPSLKTKAEYANRRPLILKARREGQTLTAIGNTWGITGERVRQIIKEELRRRSRAD
jgi:DNA-directed RNA polymerase sigma subunit (sigma70/sigma32)